MEKFIIEGNHTLSGDVTLAGNKNAALPLLSASLLTEAEVRLYNVPDIGDVGTLLQILTELGVKPPQGRDTPASVCARCPIPSPQVDLVQDIRGPILLAGPMLGRFGQVVLPPPGGDLIGRRRVDTHLLALEAMGSGSTSTTRFTMRGDRLTAPTSCWMRRA